MDDNTEIIEGVYSGIVEDMSYSIMPFSYESFEGYVYDAADYISWTFFFIVGIKIGLSLIREACR